jgi:hypothetical protein
VPGGLPAPANAALNAWLECLPQYDALRLLPLFLSCRAAIRAKVALTAANLPRAAQADQLRNAARGYLALASSLVVPGHGAIVAVGGLSGSGKSTAAYALAPHLGPPPGAIVLRSDVARKRRFNVEPHTRLPDSAYDSSTSRAVYGELVHSARDLARAGYVAIIDAVFGRPEQREAVRLAAASERVPFCGVWLEAPGEVMRARLEARGRDASDATAEVLRRQREEVRPPSDWTTIDASASLDRIVESAAATVGKEGIGLAPVAGG